MAARLLQLDFFVQLIALFTLRRRSCGEESNHGIGPGCCKEAEVMNQMIVKLKPPSRWCPSARRTSRLADRAGSYV